MLEALGGLRFDEVVNEEDGPSSGELVGECMDLERPCNYLDSHTGVNRIEGMKCGNSMEFCVFATDTRVVL